MGHNKFNSEIVQFIPENLSIELEFHKIQEECIKYCYSKEAAFELSHQKVVIDAEIIQVMLTEVEEMFWLTQNNPLPLSVFEAVTEDVRMLKIANYTCPLDSVLRFKNLCVISKNIRAFFKDLDKKQFSFLNYRIDRLINPNAILNEISKVFSPTNEILDSASIELQRIRRSIKEINSDLHKVFKRSLLMYREKSYLADIPETIRNGRLVLGVNVEHKRNVSMISQSLVK